jgi:hypothetical protein
VAVKRQLEALSWQCIGSSGSKGAVMVVVLKLVGKTMCQHNAAAT